MSFKAFIAGCAGFELTAEERAFFSEARPWGLILFRRNIASPDQVRALTGTFRDLLGERRRRAGRSGRRPGAAPERAALAGLSARRRLRSARMRTKSWPALSARLIAAGPAEVGIAVDCLPVLDVPVAGGH